MIFTSLTFLVFFGVVLALMGVIRSARGRIWMLLVASYVFYGNWEYRYVVLLFLYGLGGWALGLAMHHSQSSSRRLLCLWAGVALGLGALSYFKYANFFGDALADLFGVAPWGHVDVLLPVGISFFTFHTLSYLIDLYRREIPPCRDPAKFFLFVAFFPQLVAGPILRASNFLPQLDKKFRVTWPNFVFGSQLFLGGAVQKSLFADHLSIFVDQVYRSPEIYSAGTLWLAVAAYAMQIFCDFAGYSLMAIGTARILGFELPENFRMPYLAKSVAEFWHRWHISLSTWLRDYLYIPLGGNRLGPTRTQVNMLITMLLGGLWHGASWNFVLWGAMHGMALVVHRAWVGWKKRHGVESVGATGATLSWLLTLLFCCLAWIPFRSPTWDTTMQFVRGLLPDGSGIAWHHTPTIFILLCAVAWHAAWQFLPQVAGRFPFKPAEIGGWRALLVLGHAVLLLVLLVPLNTQPFIYFQF